MSEELKILIIFTIWLFSAYFGSFSSWGVSALSIALMTMIGIPPQMAGITFKLGKIGDTLGGLYHFHKGWHIRGEYVLFGGLALMTGSFLGSYIITTLSDTIMYFGCGISMIVLTTISYLKKEKNTKKQMISPLRATMGYVTYFVLAIVGNMFPAGSGVWYYFANTLILKLTPIESKWIASVLAIFWFVGTFFGILTAGMYNFPWAIALALGMFVWWYLGTKHMIHIGDIKLEKILLSTIFLFALYFLYLGYNSWSSI